MPPATLANSATSSPIYEQETETFLLINVSGFPRLGQPSTGRRRSRTGHAEMRNPGG